MLYLEDDTKGAVHRLRAIFASTVCTIPAGLFAFVAPFKRATKTLAIARKSFHIKMMDYWFYDLHWIYRKK